MAGIPFQRDTAEQAAPTFILLLEPLINAYLPLVADILQDLGMVADSIVIEIGDEGTGKVRAVGTASNPCPVRCTESDLALLAIRHKAALGKAAITVEVVQGHSMAGGHELADLSQPPLLFLITTGTI